MKNHVTPRHTARPKSVVVIGTKVMPSAPVTLEMSIIRKIFVIVKYQRNVFLICYEM